MSLDAYMSRLQNMPTSPDIIAREMQQAVVDEQWENTTLLSVVAEETINRDFIFEDIEVWKNSVSEFYTNIIKDEKDYRRLLFKEQTHQVERGRYYKFEDNYWITYEQTNINEPFAEILVRRCNNFAKWIDKETGEYCEYPCILDYEAMSPKQQETKNIITPNNSIELIIQGNANTVKLKENQRFIFNGRPFKIEGYNNYMQSDFANKDINMLSFFVYLDEKKSTDDFENGIADGLEYNFDLVIQNKITKGLKNGTGKFIANVLQGNKILNKPIKWVSDNNNGTINNNGEFVLTGDVGNTAIFKAKWSDLEDSVNVKIEESIVAQTQIIITPNITNIRQGQSITLTPKVYVNGSETSNSVTATTSGADNSCYKFTDNGNGTYTLSDTTRSVDDLIITWSYNSTILKQTIKLNAMF